ncbi:MAG TPA: HNH endonuclease signature motif containing protein [Solirubrobacteraceae bacterium]|nr:HNH endonuclease signature motif containing protein [Solirubrobacteraceae bacterium]
MFELGKVYRRRDLHDEYGGQRQGGIVTPADEPFILLVTGEAGRDYGYEDSELSDGTFIYFGEGQVGDMEFKRGNRAVRDHARDGRDLYLFEKVPTAHLRYRGQYFCAGYETVKHVPDADGGRRNAIAFRLLPIEADDADDRAVEDDLADLTLAQLRIAALEAPGEGVAPSKVKVTAYRRSAAVREYVLARAAGTCEGCARPAPFTTMAGRPYLEPHHTRRISDGGPDHRAHVIGLCPTCHRRVHHANDGAAYNESLMQKLADLENADL